MKKLLLATLLTLAFATQAYSLSIVRLGVEYFPDKDRSRAISSGYIYVGEPDLDPSVPANQKTLSVQQESGTIVSVAQPIRTNAGGVPVYNGSPVTLLVDGNYSLLVQNSIGSQEYYVPSLDGGPVSSNLSAYGCNFETMLSQVGVLVDTHIIIDCEPDVLTSNVTIPSNIALEWMYGAVASGPYTLTINGPIVAGLYQIFDSSLTVVLAQESTQQKSDEWFGITSENNTGYGKGALASVEVGTGTGRNTAFGVNAGTNITIGQKNTAIGVNALATATTGSWNIAIGDEAQLGTTTGTSNIAIGRQALTSNTNSSDNVAIGERAMGDHSAQGDLSGGQNTAVGHESMEKSIDGTDNTALGLASLRYNLNGDSNTAIGMSALFDTLSNDNTAVGKYCFLANTTGTGNVGVGKDTFIANLTGDYNVGIGFDAGKSNTSSSKNIAIGLRAMQSQTTGGPTIAIGGDSARNNVLGQNNIAIGDTSLFSNINGSNNTVLGVEAGFNGSPLLTSLASCTFIGKAATSSTDGISNATAIGNGATVTATNQVQIGNSAAGPFGFGANKIAWLAAAPVAGTWAQGDRVFNSAATVGQPKGWVCTVAGTPGTWVSEGNL